MDYSNFVITSLPRSRTAWLTAVLNAHGVPTIHERRHFFPNDTQLSDLKTWLDFGTEDNPRGYVDSLASINSPEFLVEYFQNKPFVVIHRKPEDCYHSLKTWSGVTPTNEQARQASRRWAHFLELLNRTVPLHALHVNYEDLENRDCVNNICLYTTRRPISDLNWHLFNHLKIELHRDKSDGYVEKFGALND